MVELTSSDQSKIERLKRQLNHAPLGSKEAASLRRAIKKVRGKAKER